MSVKVLGLNGNWDIFGCTTTNNGNVCGLNISIIILNSKNLYSANTGTLRLESGRSAFSSHCEEADITGVEIQSVI